MSYMGNSPPNIGAYGVESFNGGGTSFTLSKAATTATVLLFIDGVRQTPGDAYSVSGTTLTTTGTTPSGTDNVTVQFLGDVVDFGEPSDDSVTSAKIVDGAIVNADINSSAAIAKTKLASLDIVNADVNASAAIALSKLASDPSNASNLASGTVPTARLGSGTASSSVFLRGDQSWAEAGGGKVLQYQIKQGYSGQIVVDNNTTYTSAGTSWNISITPAATSSKIIVIWGSLINPKGTSAYQGRLKIYRQIDGGGYSDIDGQADSVPQMTITANESEIVPVNTIYTDTTHNTTSQIDYQIYMSTSNNMLCEFADTTSYRYISAMEIGA